MTRREWKKGQPGSFALQCAIAFGWLAVVSAASLALFYLWGHQ